MKQKNEQAVLLSREARISYKEAYDEMRVINWATGLSFSDYIKHDLHSVEPSLRFRKAERICDLQNFKENYIQEISETLNIDASEVLKNYRRLRKQYKGRFTVNTTIYHDYGLYAMNEADIVTAIDCLAERRILALRFREILDSEESPSTHTVELEELYGKIKELNAKLITPALTDKFRREFSAVYPQMNADPESARAISLDFMTVRSAAGYNTLNYKLYDLFNLPLIEKLAYVPKREKKSLVDKFNSPSARLLLDDKYSCYLKFKPYFGREMISIKGISDFPAFWMFTRKHRVFVKKPLYSQQGKGIRRVNADDYHSVREMLLELLKEDGEFIAEEIIHGHELTACFNRESLNTIRILTFNAGKRILELDESSEAFVKGIISYTGEGVYCLAPFFKAGRKGSFVDNAGGGGVFSAISLVDGKSSCIASDEDGAIYTEHPDSGVRFSSLQFDTIRNAIALVSKLAPEISDARFIGWDLAFTDKGEWVIVEANYSPTFIGQAPARLGIRDAVHTLSLFT